jgi:hypothetical protein
MFARILCVVWLFLGSLTLDASLHSDQTANHRIENWVYPDAATRTGATGFVAADVGKVAYQSDTGAYYRLTATSPTWQQIGGSTNLGSGTLLNWNSDTAIGRSAAGVVEINNNTASKLAGLNLGTLTTKSLSIPVPSQNLIGSGSGTNWRYQVVAVAGDGSSSAASSLTLASGPSTINGTNFWRITWPAITGAASYDVYRVVAGTTPSTTGKVGNTALLTFDDTGLAGDATTPPGANTTGQLRLASGSINTRNDPSIRFGTQSSTSGFGWDDGSSMFYMMYAGAIIWASGSGGACSIANDRLFKWSSSTQAIGTPDLGLGRNAAGVAEVNNGTNGSYRDIKARTFISDTTVRLKGYTVATLPASPAQGDMAYVTDAITPTYNGTLTGGGAVVVPVFYNGAAWTSH